MSCSMKGNHGVIKTAAVESGVPLQQARDTFHSLCLQIRADQRTGATALPDPDPEEYLAFLRARRRDATTSPTLNPADRDRIITDLDCRIAMVRDGGGPLPSPVTFAALQRLRAEVDIRATTGAAGRTAGHAVAAAAPADWTVTERGADPNGARYITFAASAPDGTPLQVTFTFNDDGTVRWAVRDPSVDAGMPAPQTTGTGANLRSAMNAAVARTRAATWVDPHHNPTGSPSGSETSGHPNPAGLWQPAGIPSTWTGDTSVADDATYLTETPDGEDAAVHFRYQPDSGTYAWQIRQPGSTTDAITGTAATGQDAVNAAQDAIASITGRCGDCGRFTSSRYPHHCISGTVSPAAPTGPPTTQQAPQPNPAPADSAPAVAATPARPPPRRRPTGKHCATGATSSTCATTCAAASTTTNRLSPPASTASTPSTTSTWSTESTSPSKEAAPTPDGTPPPSIPRSPTGSRTP